MFERKDLNEYNWELFFEEFQEETPRSAVIISGAFLDALLRDLLATFMIDSKKDVDELLGSEKDAEKPLGSFGARKKAAYCLGLINETEYHDLKIIQKVRNKFAHKMHGFSFEDFAIVNLCNSLKISLPVNHEQTNNEQLHREKYIQSIALLVNFLGARILSIQKDKRSILR